MREPSPDSSPYLRHVLGRTEPVEPWLRTPPGERKPHPEPREPGALVSPLAPPAPGTPLPDGTTVDEHGHVAATGDVLG